MQSKRGPLRNISPRYLKTVVRPWRPFAGSYLKTSTMITRRVFSTV